MLDRTTTLFSHIKPGDIHFRTDGLRDFFLYRDLGIAEAGSTAPAREVIVTTARTQMLCISSI